MVQPHAVYHSSNYSFILTANLFSKLRLNNIILHLIWSKKKISDTDKIFLLNWNNKPRNFNWISSKRSQTLFRICQSNHLWNYRFSNQLCSFQLSSLYRQTQVEPNPTQINFLLCNLRKKSFTRSFVRSTLLTHMFALFLPPPTPAFSKPDIIKLTQQSLL